MRQLREYGIYRLPGAMRPVYSLPTSGKFYLYDVEFGSNVPPRFVVEEDGRLVNWHGDQMALTVEDLIDTGESYDSEQ